MSEDLIDKKQNSRSTKKIIFSIICIVMIAVFVIALSPKAMQNDTFWSIKVGERLVKDGVFGIDYFSIHEDLNYVAHHFLTDVVIYLVYNFFDFVGLYVLECILALVMAGLLFYLNNLICKNKIISVVLFILQMIVLSMYIAVRAQMFSFILFLVEIILLEKYKGKENKWYLIALSVIPVILANFHMGVVPFYFIILGVYGLSYIKLNFLCFETVEKTNKQALFKLVIVGIIGVATVFLNPYGIDGVLYPFKTFGNDFIMSTIVEFKPYNVGLDGGLILFYSVIVIFLLILNKGKIKLNDMLIICGTLFMTFTSIRYASLFAICSAVVLRYTENIKTFFSNLKDYDMKAIYVEVLVAIILIVMRRFLLFSSEYVPENTYPIQAVEYLKENMTEDTRIFNAYEWGSYLMLNDIKVYIDSRCDLYTEEYSGVTVATDYNKITGCAKDWRGLVEKYNINAFLIQVKENESLSTLLTESTDFKEVYRDDVAVIYTKVKE